MNRARRQIELMEEYRTRLIADVVTGKIDVRTQRVSLSQARLIRMQEQSRFQQDIANLIQAGSELLNEIRDHIKATDELYKTDTLTEGTRQISRNA